MINLHESYVAEVEFKLVTPGSIVRHPTDCAIELCMRYVLSCVTHIDTENCDYLEHPYNTTMTSIVRLDSLWILNRISMHREDPEQTGQRHGLNMAFTLCI